ncbi:uncharacterized protein V6R79_014394 [Siganus canaliculatus]
MQRTEQSSCTEDRIQHVLERCLCDLGVDSPDKQLWNAGLCVNRWCLEELVKRDAHNFLILLQKILQKTKEVLQQSRYELVVPLALLFSSTLLKAPHVAPDSGVLQEASGLFRGFLSWPEPCCSAAKRLLRVVQQELRAPGISFQRLVRTEQGVSLQSHCSKTITVLLLSPDDDVPAEIQSVSEQLSSSRHSGRDVAITLILHGFQAVLGPEQDRQELHAALQSKHPEDLDQILEALTDSMETAASEADPSAARAALQQSVERLRESLSIPTPSDGRRHSRAVETFTLPFPKCLSCSWDNDSFDFLNQIIASDSDLDSDCFLKTEMEEDDTNDTSVDEEDEPEAARAEAELQSHRISTASSSSRDSTVSSSSWSGFSVPSASSGVESDFSEDATIEDADEGQDGQPKSRNKPKKKSRSLRFSLLFKPPRSPNVCRRAQSLGYRGDVTKDFQRTGSYLKRQQSLNASAGVLGSSTPLKHTCIRRRPILSCHEDAAVEAPTLVKVVVFGGDREAGRLARAYSDLQQKESKRPRLTKTCKLQFYLVPIRRRTMGSPGGRQTPTEGQTGSLSKAAASGDSNGSVVEEGTTDIAQMLGMMDPWYERNVQSLLSLSHAVLCQQTNSKDGDVSLSSTEAPPLLAELVLYYCRHAEQPALVQLYLAELTLAGGERRREVFIHSLELGHTAGTRAIKAMGAASKRFGIDEESEAVPLTLKVAYNKVAVSGRSQWIHTDLVCTSINLHKVCRTPEQLDSRTESLQLTMAEVLKRQCSKSKKSYNQHISVTEVKVDKVQVAGGEDGTTFAVCLDQDEKKVVQSVTRCDVSLCCKPGSGSDWRCYQPPPGQVQPLHASYCSLLCLPVSSFSASCP